MKIGLGVTALINGQTGGRVDGIGHYTEALCSGLQLADVSAQPYAFLGKKASLGPFKHCIPLGRLRFQGVFSSILGVPLVTASRIEKDVSLFHATDHIIPKLSHIPVISTVMDPIALAHPEWVGGRLRWLKNAYFKKTVGFSRKVITISEYSASEIQTFFNVPSHMIEVTPLGVDNSYYEVIDEQVRSSVLAGCGIRKKFFLSIGTIQPRKNIERLLLAYQSLPKFISEEFDLVIAGGYGWECDELLAKLEAGVAGVHWLGYVADDQKKALLQSCKALVFPSLYEGFGLPVLEAFASGVPVITSNLSALPEVSGGAAILVDPYNVDDISSAMRSVVELDDLSKGLVERGEARAKRFSWGATVKDTIRIYQSVL